MNTLKIFGTLLVAETVNAVMHAALASSAGVELPFHVLSNAVTIVLIVIAARASVSAGLGTITAGIYASFIWLWFMLCSALIIVFEASNDPIPWEGMALATTLFWPVGVAIGVCAAWASRKLSKSVTTRA